MFVRRIDMLRFSGSSWVTLLVGHSICKRVVDRSGRAVQSREGARPRHKGERSART